jgi:hypothetical protein
VLGRTEFAGVHAHLLLEWTCIALVAGSAALAPRRGPSGNVAPRP